MFLSLLPKSQAPYNPAIGWICLDPVSYSIRTPEINMLRTSSWFGAPQNIVRRMCPSHTKNRLGGLIGRARCKGLPPDCNDGNCFCLSAKCDRGQAGPTLVLRCWRVLFRLMLIPRVYCLRHPREHRPQLLYSRFHTSSDPCITVAFNTQSSLTEPQQVADVDCQCWCGIKAFSSMTLTSSNHGLQRVGGFGRPGMTSHTATRKDIDARYAYRRKATEQEMAVPSGI